MALKSFNLKLIQRVWWDAPKSMWKMYFSRDSIFLIFWNAPKSKNFIFCFFSVKNWSHANFFEMPNFFMFDFSWNAPFFPFSEKDKKRISWYLPYVPYFTVNKQDGNSYSCCVTDKLGGQRGNWKWKNENG